MKAYLPALSIFAAILLLSLWTEQQVEQDTQLWQAELREAQAQCVQEDWPAVQKSLAQVHQDWNTRSTPLHIFFPHSVLEETETLFAQAMAFAAEEERSETMAQMAALQAQLCILRDMGQLSVENIL